MPIHGDPTFAQWGISEWGGGVLLDIQRYFADALVSSEDTPLEYDADVIALEAFTLEHDADVLALKTSDPQRFDVDVFVTRLPTDKLDGKSIKPIVLVQIDYPAGTQRISKRGKTYAGLGWDGKLINASDLSRSLGDGTDDLRLRIADTDPRISDTWTDAQPPEGSTVTVYIIALDDPRQSLITIFEGRVEQVIRVTDAFYELEVVRSDAVLDRTIGRLLDTTIAPNAPDESLARMIPHVYGELEEHEGLVTDFNAVGALASPITTNTTSLILRSGSRFGTSGTVKIGEELIDFAGKSGDELTGLTRGASGTVASEHQSGATVIEQGTFEVTWVDHPSTSITDIQFLDPDGNLQVPSPLPTTTDTATGKSTWDQTPTITFPSSTEVLVIGTETPAGGNTAASPLSAAFESPGYSDLAFSTVGLGSTLALTRSNPVEDEGEITRVGLVVAFDLNAVGATVDVNGTGLGVLSAAENIPAWAIRRLSRQIKTTYDVNDPTHSHSASTTTVQVRPQIDLTTTGLWNTIPQGRNGDISNSANYRESIQPNAQGVLVPVGLPLAYTGAQISLSQGQQVVSATLNMWAGGPSFTGQFANLQATASIHATSNPTAAAQNAALIRNVTQTGSPGTAALYTSTAISASQLGSVANWPQITWIIRPNPSQFNRQELDTMALRDIYLNVELSQGIVANDTGISQRRTQINFFDVTSLVGGSWSWFETAVASITASAGGDIRIGSVLWAVETRQKRTAAVEVPRAFARVRGLEPQGRPTEIARSVITSAPPLGMGLTTDNIIQGSYSIASSSLAGDGIRQDFGIYDRIGALELLTKIADQADLRQVWESGRHGLSRKPDIANLPAAFKTYLKADVLGITRTRQPIGEVVNEATVSYRPLRRTGDPTRTLTQADAASQALFGIFPSSVELDLVTDDTTATIVTSRRLARSSLPRWLVTLDLPLFALDLRRGDILTLSHSEFSFTAAEVLSLPVKISGGFVRVRAELVVWSA